MRFHRFGLAFLLAGNVSACAMGYGGSGAAPANPNTDTSATTQNVTTSTTPTTTETTTTTTADGGPYTLTVSGSGFADVDGKMVNAALLDPNGNMVGHSADANVTGGAFSLTFSNVLQPNQAYQLAYYIDKNANGFCNAPGVDINGVAPVAAATADASVTVTEDPNGASSCQNFGDFALNFSAENFQVHTGDNFYVTVIDLKDKTRVVAPKMELIPNSPAPMNFSWAHLLVTGHSYQVSFFADVDRNDMCDTVDHQYATAVPPVSADVNAVGMHNLNPQQICASFPTGKLD